MGTVCAPSVPLIFKLRAVLNEALRRFRVTMCIFKNHELVLGMHDAERTQDVDACEFASEFTLPEYFLSPGEYSVDVNMYSEATGEYLLAKSLLLFSISTEWALLYEPSHAMGIVNLRKSGVRTIVSSQPDPAPSGQAGVTA